jgi:large subunit ribosomal protein L30
MSVLKVTWIKSAIGRPDRQARTIRALGLRKLHQSVEHEDTPQVRGMIQSVIHLVKLEETE